MRAELEVVRRFADDEEFRTELHSDLEGSLARRGFTLSPESATAWADVAHAMAQPRISVVGMWSPGWRRSLTRDLLILPRQS
jgi:hypothetical protein